MTEHPAWVFYNDTGIAVFEPGDSKLMTAIADTVLLTGKSHWQVVTEALEGVFLAKAELAARPDTHP